MTEDEWLADLSYQCKSCPDCWEVPCAGCQTGGMCDAYCRCGLPGGDHYEEVGATDKERVQ